MASIPERIPNGLRLLNVANPRYVRECLVAPEVSALRIDPDILSDANDASVSMWRLADQFTSIANEMQSTPREAAAAIIDGLTAACLFEALIASLRAPRDITETNLSANEVEDICRDVSAIRLEVRQHIASVFAEATATTETVTPAAIADAAAQLHVSVSALVFSEEENSKYAPDSPQRNRGKALLNRLHSAQALFERGTPSATSAAPTPYAAKVETAFRAAAAGMTSLSVPSQVDAVAAQSIVTWMQGLVTRLEDVDTQARKLGGAWRRLNLVWQAELRGVPEQPDAVALAEAKDPFGIRVAFQSVADAAAAAIPQSFDFACDEARRVCDSTLPQAAKAATLRNDCTFNCLSKAAQVLAETREHLLPQWRQVASAGPIVTVAARDVAVAQSQSSEALRWAREVVLLVRTLLRDPKDIEHRDLLMRATQCVRNLTSAASRAAVEKPAVGPTKESEAAKELRGAAQAITEWVAALAASDAPEGVDNAVARPAVAVLEAIALGHETIMHTIDGLRTAILSQCIVGGVRPRWEKATPAQRQGAVADVTRQNPCGFADAVVDRLSVLTKHREAEFTVLPADRKWLPLARAWARLNASLPTLEPHVSWEVGAVGCKFTMDVTIPLTMDQLAEASKVSGFEALDYAGSAWDATLQTPAVSDAVTAAVLNQVTSYVNASAGSWNVADRRSAAAADTSGSWRFNIISNAIRSLGAAADAAARPHALVELLDELTSRIAWLGVNAINARDSCMKAILVDIVTFAPQVAQEWSNRSDGGGALWICPQCSWWRQE